MHKTISRELNSNYKLITAKDTDLTCYTFDLRKVAVPYRQHNSYYYKSNFSVDSLTVTDLDTNKRLQLYLKPNSSLQKEEAMKLVAAFMDISMTLSETQMSNMLFCFVIIVQDKTKIEILTICYVLSQLTFLI